jgi:hypothetical protein
MDRDYLKLPLQTEGGQLRKIARGDAVRQLLQTMAITPSGKWAGGEQFGIHDLLMACARVQVESHPMRRLVDVAESVLAELGFPGCRLRPQQAAELGPSSTDFHFVLTWPEGNAEEVTVRLFF